MAKHYPGFLDYYDDFVAYIKTNSKTAKILGFNISEIVEMEDIDISIADLINTQRAIDTSNPSLFGPNIGASRDINDLSGYPDFYCDEMLLKNRLDLSESYKAIQEAEDQKEKTLETSQLPKDSHQETEVQRAVQTETAETPNLKIGLIILAVIIVTVIYILLKMN